MHHRVTFLALSFALLGPGRSGAQQAPAPQGPPPEASQFDFLVGEWSVDVTSKSPGTPPRYHGVWRAAKTLNGLGMVDEYGVLDDAGRIVYAGTTLRVFDTKAATWTMRYVDEFGGETGRWSELVGVKQGSEMHVEQHWQSPDGRTTILKIRYYNIQPDHFSWAAEHSSDGGTTWVRDYGRIEAARQERPSGGDGSDRRARGGAVDDPGPAHAVELLFGGEQPDHPGVQPRPARRRGRARCARQGVTGPGSAAGRRARAGDREAAGRRAALLLVGAEQPELRPDAALRCRRPPGESAAAKSGGRRQRRGVRRAALRDARVGPARPVVGTGPHRAGRGKRDRRPQRRDSRRPHRIDAARVLGPVTGRAEESAGIRGAGRDESGRAGRQAQGCGARRARARGHSLDIPLQWQSRRRHWRGPAVQGQPHRRGAAHSRGHPRHPADAAAGREARNRVRWVGVRHPFDQRRAPDAPDRSHSRRADHFRIPAEPAGDRDPRARDPGVDRGDVRPHVCPGILYQQLHP